MSLDTTLRYFDEIHQSIIITDPTFKVHYLNKTFKIRHPRAQSAGALEALLHPDDLLPFQNLIRDGDVENSSLRVRLKKELTLSREHASVFICKKYAAIPDGVVLIESVSQYSWLRYFDLINTYSNDLLAVANEHFEIEFISPSVKSILGYTQSEFLQTDPFSIVHEEDLDNLKNKLFEAIRERADKVSLINRFRKKSGQYIWVENNLSLIYNPSNADSFKLISITRDITNMVSTHQKLFDLNELLEEAQKVGKMGWWKLNLETENLEWPLSMSYLYEHAVHDGPVTGQEFLSFIHPDDVEDVRRKYQQLFLLPHMQEHNSHETQFRIVTGKGNVKYIKSRFQWDAREKLVRGINIDISAEIESQQRLTDSEGNYRHLVDFLPFGIGIAKNNKRLYVNKKLAELFEVEQEEFLHHPLDAFVAEETRSTIATRMREIESGIHPDPHFVGKFHTAKSKALKTLDIFTSEIIWEGESARMAFLIDITEVKANQEKIIQSENMLRLAQEFAGISSWQISLTGNPHDRLINPSSFVTQIHEMDRKKVIQTFENCVNGIGPYDVEFRIKTESGNILWLAEKGNVIKNSVGVPIEMYGVTRDISKEKLREHELLQAKNHAEESFKNQEAFFSFMSHEIRTPLNAVLGLSDLLTRKPTSKKKEELIKTLKNSSDNLMHIVDGILDLSKSRIVQAKPEPLDFNIRELLSQLESSYRFLAHEKKVKFHLVVDKKIPTTLVGDMVKVYQIMNNLLDNAVKFTNQGFVRLSASLILPSAGTFLLELNVEDSGIGIPKDQLNQIFEPFHQLSFNAKKRGTGLGLSIVKNLVAQIGGSISTKSTPHAGTTFTLRVPVEIGQSSIDATQDNEYKDLAGRKVLYVEDVDTNQYLIKNLLELHRVKCDIASTGSSALKILSRKRYDLLLLDVQLPDMNGFELMEKVLSLRWNSSIAIIVFTADVTASTRSRILRSGVNEFIYKPFVSHNLLQKISTVIRKSETVNMDYYERLLKKNKSKLHKAKRLILADLEELNIKGNLYMRKKDLTGVKKMAHKFKVTAKNINARQLLALLEKMQSKKKFDSSFSRWQVEVNKEIKLAAESVKAYLR